MMFVWTEKSTVAQKGQPKYKSHNKDISHNRGFTLTEVSSVIGPGEWIDEEQETFRKSDL